MPVHGVIDVELLALAAVVLSVVVALHLTFSGFRMVGITAWEVVLLLFVSPFLAAVNLPVWQEPGVVYGANLAGAGVPVYLSLRFLRSGRLPVWKAALGTAGVAYFAHRWAQLAPEEGILVPAGPLVVVAALVGAVLAGRRPHQLGPASYGSGALGTLVGADLLNVRKLVDPGREEELFLVVGGAGTLDAIFLISLWAVVAAIVGVLAARVLGADPGR